MPKYKVNWETDGNDIDLPKIVDVPNDIEPEYVADWLSDKYGWLINSLEKVYKERKTKTYVARVLFNEKITAHNKKDALSLFREYLDTYQGDIIEDNLEIIILK